MKHLGIYLPIFVVWLHMLFVVALSGLSDSQASQSKELASAIRIESTRLRHVQSQINQATLDYRRELDPLRRQEQTSQSKLESLHQQLNKIHGK